MRRGVSYATCIWAIAFGAPHLWWAFGVNAGFPGGPTSYDFFMASPWRVVYDWFVIACSVAGAIVPVVLLNPTARPARRVAYMLAWIAFVILTLRGIAGVILDRGSDLVWNPAFVFGGVLFGFVVWFARRTPATGS